jgi:CheY-like chemotaxis protein
MLRILVIEDQQECRENLIEILELEGHSALGVSNGNEAIGILGNQHFDLIFCDIVLYEISGWEILAHVRTLRRSRKVYLPFAYVTAQAGTVNQQLAMQLGADYFITKPYRIKEIQKAIGHLFILKNLILD